MAEIGDTALTWLALPEPGVGETDVIVNLPNLIYTLGIREYCFPPGAFLGWWITGKDITDVSNIVLTITPLHSVGAATYEVGGTNDSEAVITIPSSEEFRSEKEYTWSLSMTITHWTYTHGVVTRNYSTIDAVGNTAGEEYGPMTFTTEYVFNPPTAEDEYGGEGGKTFMRTVRRLVAVGRNNKVYYEDS